MGGMEIHLQTLCQELQRHADVDVEVVVANRCTLYSRSNIDGVAVTRIGRLFSVASAPICAGLAKAIRRSRAEVLHLHMPNPAGALAYVASRHRGRLLLTWHSDVVRQKLLGKLYGPVEQAVLRRAHAIIVTSDRYLASSPTLRDYRSKCRVIPHGIPLERFSGAKDRKWEDIRRRYGPKIVLAVGRLVSFKGFEFLIRAMKRVPNATLMLIGDGPLRQSLEREASDLGLYDRVVFTGEIQNEMTAPYYRACDVFVLPSVSRSESLGIVQIEAMASGKPVINTRLDTGVPTVSVHGLTGLTVPPADSDSLAEAINSLLENPRLRAVYGRRARARASRRFRAEMMGESALRLYREVLGEAPEEVESNFVGRLRGVPAN